MVGKCLRISWVWLLLALGWSSVVECNGNIIAGYGIPLQEGVGVDTFSDSLSDDIMFRSLILPGYLDPILELLEEDGRQFWSTAWLSNVKSQECKGHMMEWFQRLGALNSNVSSIKDQDVWALHLVDSWGKIPEGILSGHVNSLGDFDECVDTVATGLRGTNTPESFKGRYCSTFLAPYSADRFAKYWETFPPTIATSAVATMSKAEGRKAVSPSRLAHLISIAYGVKLFPSFGVCFPNTCGPSDIEQIMMNVFYTVLYNGSYVENGEGGTWPAIDPELCYEGKKPDLDAGDVSVIALLGVITALCLGASSLDILLNRGLDKVPKRGIAFQCLNSFSLYTNIPRWLSTRTTADDLGCLHGIRFLSTSWIILGHTWFVIIYIPYWNLVDVKLIQDKWMNLTMINSTVSVDTFFVLSGLLVSYNVLKMLNKTNGKLNILMFYLHRYLRLTPVYAVLIGVMATLVPYTGRGPYWFIMDRWGQNCVDNWWTNLLYVNNFVNTGKPCQGEAWYLANDMQFYIVSPLFLLPLYHWERIGVAILVVATLLSTISPILMVHYMGTLPTTIGTRIGTAPMDKWYTDVYIKPYARIQTYFVGMWLGYLLFKTKGKKVHLPAPIVLLFWGISTATCLAILYGIQDWFDPTADIPEAASLIFTGLNRLGWAVSIGWVIFACVKGYGGLVNDFLSWKVFMPLGRLCYCVYLVSLHLQMILHVSFKQPIGYSEYAMTNFFFAHMMLSYLVGFFFTLMVETPFMQLEKILFEGGGGKRGGGGGNQSQRPGGVGLGSNEEGRNGIFYNATAVPNPNATLAVGQMNTKQE